MPIERDCEKLIPIAAATKLFPSRPNLATLYRWLKRGVGGRRLEAVKSGARTYTSAEACDRFIRAISEASYPSQHQAVPVGARAFTLMDVGQQAMSQGRAEAIAAAEAAVAD